MPISQTAIDPTPARSTDPLWGEMAQALMEMTPFEGVTFEHLLDLVDKRQSPRGEAR